MRSHHLILILAGMLVFLAGALLAGSSAAPPPPPAAPAPVAEIPSHMVLVARTDLPSGRFVQESDFAWQSRPVNTLRPELILKGSDSTASLVGGILLQDRRAGEVIQRSDVISPRDRGFLAAVLPPGMRSLSVQVDDVSATPGLIFPGDRVDVIVTHTLAGNKDPGRHAIGQIVLSNIRVLAVDRSLDGPIERSGPAPGSVEAAGGSRGNAIAAANANAASGRSRTVTLEVSPKEAEVLSVAVALGRLTLALRSLQRADGPEPAADGAPVWAGDVIEALTGGTPTGNGVTVLRGGVKGS